MTITGIAHFLWHLLDYASWLWLVGAVLGGTKEAGGGANVTVGVEHSIAFQLEVTKAGNALTLHFTAAALLSGTWRIALRSDSGKGTGTSGVPGAIIQEVAGESTGGEEGKELVGTITSHALTKGQLVWVEVLNTGAGFKVHKASSPTAAAAKNAGGSKKTCEAVTSWEPAELVGPSAVWIEGTESGAVYSDAGTIKATGSSTVTEKLTRVETGTVTGTASSTAAEKLCRLDTAATTAVGSQSIAEKLVRTDQGDVTAAASSTSTDTHVFHDAGTVQASASSTVSERRSYTDIAATHATATVTISELLVRHDTIVVTATATVSSTDTHVTGKAALPVKFTAGSQPRLVFTPGAQPRLTLAPGARVRTSFSPGDTT